MVKTGDNVHRSVVECDVIGNCPEHKVSRKEVWAGRYKCINVLSGQVCSLNLKATVGKCGKAVALEVGGFERSLRL